MSDEMDYAINSHRLANRSRLMGASISLTAVAVILVGLMLMRGEKTFALAIIGTAAFALLAFGFLQVVSWFMGPYYDHIVVFDSTKDDLQSAITFCEQSGWRWRMIPEQELTGDGKFVFTFRREQDAAGFVICCTGLL